MVVFSVADPVPGTGLAAGSMPRRPCCTLLDGRRTSASKHSNTYSLTGPTQSRLSVSCRHTASLCRGFTVRAYRHSVRFPTQRQRGATGIRRFQASACSGCCWAVPVPDRTYSDGKSADPASWPHKRRRTISRQGSPTSSNSSRGSRRTSDTLPTTRSSCRPRLHSSRRPRCR